MPRVLLLTFLLAPAIAMGAGIGPLTAAAKGFKAGKYRNSTAVIATLRLDELRHASKSDNIDGMLALARAERRSNLNEITGLQIWEKFNALPGGDRLLLSCLKEPKCEPLKLAEIAKLSDLHHQVLLRQPGKNLAQTNQAVGVVSEQVMIRHFESTGWKQIEGEVGRNGIDGLFVKRNPAGVVREVLAVESKYNTSSLQTTKHGQQMSREWIEKKLQSLRERQPDDATYRDVEKLVGAGYYRARLWTMRVKDGAIQIDLQRVRSSADKVDELIDDPGIRVAVPPEVIRMSEPKDDFERTIVDAYRQALDKLGHQS